jgi:transposase
MRVYRDITDQEWEGIASLLPELKPRREARGRPLTNTREVLNGVLWVMFSGASWASLPRKYPSYQTCHRRFKIWYDTGVWKRLTRRLFGHSSAAFLEVVVGRTRTGSPAALPVADRKPARKSVSKVAKKAVKKPAATAKPALEKRPARGSARRVAAGIS